MARLSLNQQPPRDQSGADVRDGRAVESEACPQTSLSHSKGCVEAGHKQLRQAVWGVGCRQAEASRDDISEEPK